MQEAEALFSTEKRDHLNRIAITMCSINRLLGNVINDEGLISTYFEIAKAIKYLCTL